MSNASPTTLLLRPKVGRANTILAVSVTNAIEWFEIVIFGYFAGIISRLFFPSDDPRTSLLLTFATFGVTFVMRPLGAIALGSYGDRRGRKAALQLSIVLMMAGSAAIAFTPDYRSIGYLAPVILLAGRLVQGFAVGGEFGSATAFLAEQDPARRGFYASWQFASQGLTALLATASGAIVTASLAPEAIDAWGWRIPFAFGLIIGPIGYFIRRNLEETTEFTAGKPQPRPFRSLVQHDLARLFVAIGLIVFGTVAIYTIVFMPTFAARQLGLSVPKSFMAASLTGILQLILVPIFGALSDRIGRLPFPIASAAITLCVVYPAFNWLASDPTIEKLIAIQVALGILTACYMGPIPALMSELFQVTRRTTALSVSYALAVAIFGGFAPFVHAWLIDVTGTKIAPSYYVIFAALVSLLALFMVPRVQRR
jgi:MHS family proline/betaine transporter-like MFS transporter